MACVHVDFIHDEDVRASVNGDSYLGLYQSYVDEQFDVRLATSSDLIHWTYRITLVTNADMPYLIRVPNSPWLLLAHE